MNLKRRQRSAIRVLFVNSESEAVVKSLRKELQDIRTENEKLTSDYLSCKATLDGFSDSKKQIDSMSSKLASQAKLLESATSEKNELLMKIASLEATLANAQVAPPSTDSPTALAKIEFYKTLTGMEVAQVVETPDLKSYRCIQSGLNKGILKLIRN
jgi:hypothetical protein